MILIADSGSTKCSWVLCDTNAKIIKETSTIGFNPYFIDHLSIIKNLKKSQLNNYKHEVTYIFFYGAGCSSQEKNKLIELPLKEFFNNAKISISHDLDAACFAMHNGSANITCILGTGSNSCFYDGKEIVEHNQSLGFILGDEASGNYFGKKILSLYFNNKMPNELKTKLESAFETDITIINKTIYHTNNANVFLAKYFPFIIETKSHSLIQQLIKDSLDEFINLRVKCFSNCNKVKVNFIGSVSYFLSEEIFDCLKRNNLKSGDILKNPIKRLIPFQFNKINEINS